MSDTSYLDEIEEDALAPSDSALSRISQLATMQVELEGELDIAEQKVKDIKVRLEKVCGNLLPEAMAEAKMEEFKMITGQKVTVKDEIQCSVPKKRKGEIMKKLREIGQEDLIVNKISVDIEKGHDNLAGDLMGHAEDLGLLATRAETVNTASLKKFLREQLDDGEDIDLPFFGAFQLRRTKIKQ